MEDKTKERVRNMQASVSKLEKEISKAIVGHEDIIEGVLVCLLCGGHALLEGVPGLGKTYLIKCLGEASNLKASRIQFTPDLMPADILGTNVMVQDERGSQHIQFQSGPIFANILLADEINRATPKTQSALLEAMQEQNVTVGGVRYPLDGPFIVLATQNPIEMEGTYPLPEAQLDRFFFKLNVEYPSPEQIGLIIDRTTMGSLPSLSKVVDAPFINEMKSLVKEVPIAKHVEDYAIRIVLSTHPDSEYGTGMAKRYIKYGSSPRGAQSLVLAGKVYALLDGRFNVSFDDVRKALMPGLRHRIILNFEGEAEGIQPEEILAEAARVIPEVAEKKVLTTN
jgi:MoxR-like ATPase